MLLRDVAYLSRSNITVSDRTNFREALQTGFFGLQKARDTYRMLVGSCGLHKDLVRKFIEVQAIVLSPICPYFCDYVWRTYLGHTTSVTQASWPTLPEVDMTISKQGEYLFANSHEFVKAVAVGLLLCTTHSTSAARCATQQL
jgi:leucyl-tRNA synthetase